jgi:hypothetical protein
VGTDSIAAREAQRDDAATKERGIYAASPHGHLETLKFAETEPDRTEKRRERCAPKNLRQNERFGRIATQRPQRMFDTNFTH